MTENNEINIYKSYDQLFIEKNYNNNQNIGIFNISDIYNIQKINNYKVLIFCRNNIKHTIEIENTRYYNKDLYTELRQVLYSDSKKYKQW